MLTITFALASARTLDLLALRRYTSAWGFPSRTTDLDLVSYGKASDRIHSYGSSYPFRPKSPCVSWLTQHQSLWHSTLSSNLPSGLDWASLYLVQLVMFLSMVSFILHGVSRSTSSSMVLAESSLDVVERAPMAVPAISTFTHLNVLAFCLTMSSIIRAAMKRKAEGSSGKAFFPETGLE